jgi:cobalt-zinc-cadmium efflux system membrane fusion protein
MTGEHRLNLSPTVAVLAVLSVLSIGVGATYLIMRPGASSEPMSGTSNAAGSTPAPSVAASAVVSAGVTSPRADVVVTLTPDAVQRAGIEVSEATSATGTDHIRLPGVVEPNAYRQVAVTPLVGGRVVRVSAQLGDRVRGGQALAEVYAPELAEARTKYTAAKAMLEAHDRELQRTQKLMEIGAASRQELERIHAEHAAQTAEVESAKARLQLLGAAPDEPAPGKADAATITVVAPIDGVITERLANVGLNVDASAKLFSVVDLSKVWIVADMYEKDLGRVRVGASATVTTAAYPGLSLSGRVSYIDPQLNVATRTAKARIEVTNPHGELRLGMYADVAIETEGGVSAISIPKAAVQNVADRQVVYVAMANEPSKFIEREVRLGNSSGDVVEVVSGLSAREPVVSKGSFFIRAEAERLGLRNAPGSTSPSTMSMPGSTAAAADVQSAKIAVTEKGYEPDKVTLRAGVPARLTVVRMTDKTCGTEIVFPALNIKRALPLNEPVVIEFTPAKTGDIAFACGMNMLKGIVMVQ